MRIVDENISLKYNKYLKQHIEGVYKGFRWIYKYLPAMFQDLDYYKLERLIQKHDQSKFSIKEYSAYANYFYGSETDTVKINFDKAWNHHQKFNPHHWQYWILINDEDGTYCLDMDYKYIIEMICDWWSFSWCNGDLYEVFDWYNNHKNFIQLSEKTRDIVEIMLSNIKIKLDELQGEENND